MLIEVKSKTNKPDEVPKKTQLSGKGRVTCRGGMGSLGYWQTNALINFPPEPKSQRKGAEALLRTVGGRLREEELGSFWGSKFMWAARRCRRRQNFCIEFERAKQFRFLFLFFSLVFIFIYPFNTRTHAHALHAPAHRFL